MTAADEQLEGWGVDESSGFLETYGATIVESYFQENTEYGGTQLVWEMELLPDSWDDEAFPDMEAGQEMTRFFSCGSTWVLDDDTGKSVSHNSGKPNKNFRADSQYGKILALVLGKAEDYGDSAEYPEDPPAINFEGLLPVLQERGTPNEAGIWVGIKLGFEETGFDYGVIKKGPDKGKPMKATPRAFPHTFLGVAGEEEAAEPASKPAKKPAKSAKKANPKVEEAKAKAAAAKSNGKATFDSILEGVTVDEEVKVAIKEVLDASDDHETFMSDVLEVEGVVENDELVAVIVDEGAEGLWATKA